MKKIFVLLVILSAVFITGCSDSGENGAAETINGAGGVQAETGGLINIDLSGGADTFIGFEPEMLAVRIMREDEIVQFDFVGVSLNLALESRGVTEFTKIELAIADSGVMDITEMAQTEAGVFLAWSESGVPETPFRVFPKDAGTDNLLIGNVTEIIITR